MTNNELNEILNWAFGRKDIPLNQVVYLDAVEETERLARLGAEVEPIIKTLAWAYRNNKGFPDCVGDTADVFDAGQKLVALYWRSGGTNEHG